jgi:hypothetical protein
LSQDSHVAFSLIYFNPLSYFIGFFIFCRNVCSIFSSVRMCIIALCTFLYIVILSILKYLLFSLFSSTKQDIFHSLRVEVISENFSTIFNCLLIFFKGTSIFTAFFLSLLASAVFFLPQKPYYHHFLSVSLAIFLHFLSREIFFVYLYKIEDTKKEFCTLYLLVVRILCEMWRTGWFELFLFPSLNSFSLLHLKSAAFPFASFFSSFSFHFFINLSQLVSIPLFSIISFFFCVTPFLLLVSL